MKERKLNNKGFSLVELIIVIAIMVILVVVFAPQYLRFVNNSRISTDVQTAANMVTAIESSIAEGSQPFGSNSDVTVDEIGDFAATIPNFTALPASRLTGDNTSWIITGNDNTGVTRITLTTANDAGTNVNYEIYPDPDSSTNHGINNMHTGTSPADGRRQ